MAGQIGGGGNPLMMGGGGGGYGQGPHINDWLRGLAQQMAARRQAAQGSAPQQTGITPDGRPIITYTPPQQTGLFGMPMPFAPRVQPITAEVGALTTPTGAAPNAPTILPAGPMGPTGASVTMSAIVSNLVPGVPVAPPVNACGPMSIGV